MVFKLVGWVPAGAAPSRTGLFAAVGFKDRRGTDVAGAVGQRSAADRAGEKSVTTERRCQSRRQAPLESSAETMSV